MVALDLIVLLVLSVAVLRGLLRGMIREVFSVLALAGACIAVRFYTTPLAQRLDEVADGRVGSTAAWALSAVAIAIGTVALVAFAGSFLRRGAKSVGLGWADRLGGSVLGLVEGGLVAAVLLLLAVRVLGGDAPTLRNSRSMAALEELTRVVQGQPKASGDVAAPPPAKGAL